MAHRIVSKLAVIAALAAAIPAAASAREGDRDCEHRPAPVVVAPVHVPAPPPPAWSGRHERDRHWRENAWRERELRRVSSELRALDAERAAFHARFAHNPRKLARYDRSYLERRASLERRWSELSYRVAWR